MGLANNLAINKCVIGDDFNTLLFSHGFAERQSIPLDEAHP
jgi:hypothetical protein